MYICVCKKVCDETIKEECLKNQGKIKPKDILAKLKVGTKCGRCRYSAYKFIDSIEAEIEKNSENKKSSFAKKLKHLFKKKK